MNIKNTSRPKVMNNTKGFTIIELMIATVVMSLILLLLTTGVLQITNGYYEGITATNTQNAARNIINTISQSLQFQGVPFNPGTMISPTQYPVAGKMYYFCIGNQEYIYQIGYETVKPSQTPTSVQAYHGFVLQTEPHCIVPPSNYLQQQTLPSGATDFLSPSMRLSTLEVTALTNLPNTDNDQQLYEIDVQVTYGDDSVLFDPGDSTNPSNNIDTSCSDTGATNVSTVFCSTADLHTVVDRRVYTQ